MCSISDSLDMSKAVDVFDFLNKEVFDELPNHDQPNGAAFEGRHGSVEQGRTNSQCHKVESDDDIVVAPEKTPSLRRPPYTKNLNFNCKGGKAHVLQSRCYVANSDAECNCYIQIPRHPTANFAIWNP